MSITDPEASSHIEDDDAWDGDQTPLPNRRELRWPIVQALREIGRPASDEEIAEHVADSMSLTHEQRTVMIPSGQETRLKNRVGWAGLELKHVGVIHRPKPGLRELTTLGQEADETRIQALRAEYEANKRRNQSAEEPPEGQEQADTPRAWLIRAGRDGDRFDYNIEHGLSCLGWDDVPDLRGFSSRQDLRDAVRPHYPDSSEGTISSITSQLWRMRTDVRLGDLVVMPRKGVPEIALGSVTREYWYDEASDVAWGRHVVSVDWKRTEVPKAALNQDLQRSLGSQQTIFTLARDDAPWRLQQVMETGRDPGARMGDATGPGNVGADLSALVERFRAETGYRTEAHDEQERLRAEWAVKLAPENIANFSRHDLTAVASHGAWNKAMYVYPNPRGEMQWIRNLGDEEYARLLDHIRYLCWGDDELWLRYDQLTDSRSDRKVKGLKNETTSKLIAICHPEDFLPIGTHEGRWSRETMLHRLGLPRPSGSSHGQRVVDANNRLREHLEPHFGDDTFGMGAFLEWLLQQEISGTPMGLTELADELLVGIESLEDIVSLLEDKGQVILYGPPGTGKTYLARELAKELAPDDSCRVLVQFHPSTSYEDFFEGYRPAGTGDDGGIRYELTPGPLARMAERASEAPDQQHVMIIDEINRGNLPRVLGELLFLLEYRNESVQPLYRPEEPFSLPDNLWFIGTMNTADRSIALVDAALRRRFHFVPFFPDSGPMAGLLGRWLDREDEPAWVGHLVDAVNGELKKELEGSHLLLGPSHFMKEYGSSPDQQRDRLRRIWEYNIEPFIEDQFFGDPAQIDRFRFDAVMRRNGPAEESDVDASDAGDDPESTDGSEGEHAAADGDATAQPGSTQPEDER